MKGYVKLVLPASVVAASAVAAIGIAAPGDNLPFTPVPSANTRSAGYAPASALGGGLQQLVWAQGSTALENPQGTVTHYGYENDVSTSAGSPQMLPTPSSPTEAQKTEPDENTYLVFKKGEAVGPDAAYDYGTHFLFQGHENGAGSPKQGYVTRINLDADAAHRATLMATQDSDGNPIATIDGSTWDPFARRLLLTTENNSAPTYAATAGYPSQVDDVSGALGRGGYEGIQDDSDGNIWIVEDIGGATRGTKAKRPNSFVYRYVPSQPGDLHNGKLQALQVLSDDSDRHPITFDTQALVNNPDQIALHSYGNTFQTNWVTIHDTAIDGTTPFDANAAAKAHDATPFNRPENGRFRPGSGFKEFYFDETGDTDNTSSENAAAGGWGGIQKLVQASPSAQTGVLTLFYKGDQEHAGLDNATFLSKDLVTFVEDAGDTLHGQRNALDSGWVFNAKRDYSGGSEQPARWLAEGRDASATIDASNSGFGKNDGDNEITGAIVADGDPRKEGILGAREPNLADKKWRWFYTQQHGDNVTYEVLPAY
jgi:hypothetical protein